MLKKMFSVVVLAVILMIMSTSAVQMAKSSPATITVPDDYPTIHEAIDNAYIGDTVFVRNGTYFENIIVNKAVSLVGEDRYATVIDGNDSGSVVDIYANLVEVSSFTIKNSGFAKSGIQLNNISQCNIVGNEIINNRYGIWLLGSSNNNISSNNITGNLNDGLRLNGSSNNTISGNDILVNNWWGIRLHEYSNNNDIVENHAAANDNGIELTRSSNNTISSNNIRENNRQTASARGIELWFHSNNTYISRNRIVDHRAGIEAYGCSNTTIYKNHINLCTDDGISLVGAPNNTVSENSIANNENGIRLYSYSPSLIYHNSFVNNSYQTSIYQSPNHKWDDGYPSGGNYWSDYQEKYPNATEIGHSEIWNQPYIIDENNTDNYPLIRPYNGLVLNLNTKESYFSIQEGINDASKNNRILVLSGTYYENVVVNEAVSILGEDAFSTIIHGTIYIRASNTKITELSVQDGQGIWVEDAKHCEISGVISRDSSDFGILLSNTTNSRILSNGLYSNYYDGICIDHTAQNNTIQLNDIKGFNRDGVATHSSKFNLIKANTLMNGNTGLHLSYASHNTLRNNTIINCTVGIWSEHSHNNTLYHNNFINNTTGSSTPDSKDNNWDNGCEGNYWNDYNGTDLDEDGIGDTPYIIDENNTDEYPLMNRYWNPCDINHDLRVDMKDIGSSARAFGTQPGDERWNCHADITGPVPFEPDNKVDMRDIGTTSRHFGETDS